LVKDQVTTHITFLDFHANSKKTPYLGAKEVFQRMLMQAHGITLDLAEAITDKYPTLGGKDINKDLSILDI